MAARVHARRPRGRRADAQRAVPAHGAAAAAAAADATAAAAAAAAGTLGLAGARAVGAHHCTRAARRRARGRRHHTPTAAVGAINPPVFDGSPRGTPRSALIIAHARRVGAPAVGAITPLPPSAPSSLPVFDGSPRGTPPCATVSSAVRASFVVPAGRVATRRPPPPRPLPPPPPHDGARAGRVGDGGAPRGPPSCTTRRSGCRPPAAGPTPTPMGWRPCLA